MIIDSTRLVTASGITKENGLFIPLEPIKHFNEGEYLDLAKKVIEEYQNHPNQVPYNTSSRLKLFHAPTSAVIVGTGTVGLEAIVYASRILPLHSTILILQNDVEDTSKFEDLLKTTIQGGENFQWIISAPMDIGRIDQIEEFLLNNKARLKHAQLFIHTADKAKRHVPDRLPYQDVIAQIIRRTSIPVIEDLIEKYSEAKNPYIRILFSSICSINRDTYRLANVGPYQIGKIVGDDFFKCAPVRHNSYSFILYAGGMHTMGEVLTHNEEYQTLKEGGIPMKETSEKEYFERLKNADSHVASMDSAGFMFKKIWDALEKNELALGKLYSIYGPSVPENLGYELNTLKIVEPIPYMFDPLESDPANKE